MLGKNCPGLLSCCLQAKGHFVSEVLCEINEEKLALHQSFQERGLQPDAQMLKSVPTQVISRKLSSRQVV